MDEIDDILSKIDALGLDDLSSASYDKEITMPEGIKVAYPLKSRDNILQIANELTGKYVGKGSDVFEKTQPSESCDKEYESLFSLIKQKAPIIAEKIHELYATYFDSIVYKFGKPGEIDPLGNIYGQLWSHFNFENSAFELHEPIVDYRPLEIKVSGNMIYVRDLYSGQEFSKKRIKHPELSGFTSVDAPGMDFTIPNAIEILGYTNKYGRSIKITEKTIVRAPYEKGSIRWYFPLWEIPVVNRRTAYDFEIVAVLCNLDNVMEDMYFWKTTYDDPSYFWKNFEERNPNRIEDVWKHSVPFVTTGALFFDSFFGKLVNASKSGSCFDEHNPGKDTFKYKAEKGSSQNIRRRRSAVFYGNLRETKEADNYIRNLEREWLPNIRDFNETPDGEYYKRTMKKKFGWSWKRETAEYIAKLRREANWERQAKLEEFESKFATQFEMLL